MLLIGWPRRSRTTHGVWPSSGPKGKSGVAATLCPRSPRSLTCCPTLSCQPNRPGLRWLYSAKGATLYQPGAPAPGTKTRSRMRAESPRHAGAIIRPTPLRLEEPRRWEHFTILVWQSACRQALAQVIRHLLRQVASTSSIRTTLPSARATRPTVESRTSSA